MSTSIPSPSTPQTFLPNRDTTLFLTLYVFSVVSRIEHKTSTCKASLIPRPVTCTLKYFNKYIAMF